MHLCVGEKSVTQVVDGGICVNKGDNFCVCVGCVFSFTYFIIWRTNNTNVVRT